jgi:hypothetical protein
VSVSDPFDVGAVVTLMKYYGRFDVYCMSIFLLLFSQQIFLSYSWYFAGKSF